MEEDGYAANSRRLLAKAHQEITAGDLIQASEKGWGAAAHIVKAVAQRRGWKPGSHRLLFEAVKRLADETGDPDLGDLFHIAQSLHTNFYENWEPSELVESGLRAVERFVAKLEPLLSR